jgi:hypothetical protein
MSKYIEKLDLFGNTFSFTIFQKEKFKTSIGGILSLMVVIIALVFSFLFGQDFFLRSNPKITSQRVIPHNDDLIQITSEKMAMAWRIEDVYGQPVNYTGVIFPRIDWIVFSKASDNQLVLINLVTMNLTRCNSQNSNFPQLEKQINLSNYMCLDWESIGTNFTFGGYWDSSFVHFFQISFSYCPNADAYGEGRGCSSVEKLQERFKSYGIWYFSLFYPQYVFDPNDTEYPLKIVFKNYSYRFDLNLQKADRWKFKQVILDDDQGWILPSKKNTTILSYDRIESDFTWFSESDLKKLDL